MNKQRIVETLLKRLQDNLDMLVETAVTAREAATGDESKAENKYDTRGLEAAYLAGAQAKRSEELTMQIVKTQKLVLRDYGRDSSIGMTAIVRVSVNGEEEKYFFILPFAGGTKLDVDNSEYSVITPESNVGSKLIGKKVGDTFDIKIKDKNLEYEIIDVS